MKEGLDICVVCGKTATYGTLRDVTEDSFDLICGSCARKRIAMFDSLVTIIEKAIQMNPDLGVSENTEKILKKAKKLQGNIQSEVL